MLSNVPIQCLRWPWPEIVLSLRHHEEVPGLTGCELSDAAIAIIICGMTGLFSLNASRSLLPRFPTSFARIRLTAFAT
jgi:hypothetical protein